MQKGKSNGHDYVHKQPYYWQTLKGWGVKGTLYNGCTFSVLFQPSLVKRLPTILDYSELVEYGSSIVGADVT